MTIPPHWQWKLQRYRNQLEAFKEQVREQFQSARAKQKICPSCRALISASESRCPFCSESVSALDRVGVRRATTSILPDLGSAHMLMGLNFLLFAISLVAASKVGAAWQAIISGFPGGILIDLGSNLGLGIYYGQYWRL